MIFITEDLPGSQTLLEKLATQTRPGAIIPLNEDEMKVMKSSYILGLSHNNSSIDLMEIDPNKQYLAAVDHHVNIEDIFQAIKYLKTKIGIVRIMK